MVAIDEMKAAVRVRAEDERFTVSYDGNVLFGVADRTFTEAGGVALWTKADSVTRFDQIKMTTMSRSGIE
jgi:hypothetical protein